MSPEKACKKCGSTDFISNGTKQLSRCSSCNRKRQAIYYKSTRKVRSKIVSKWDVEISVIEERLAAGDTLESIAATYRVSRQRLYQVLQKYGINTPKRTRDTYLKGKPPKYYWLNKILVAKGFSGSERTELLKTLPVPDVCPVLGISLNYNGTGVMGKYSRSENSPSIDRIDSTKGYVIGNIAVMSWRANRIKNDGTLQEHIKLVSWWEDLTK